MDFTEKLDRLTKAVGKSRVAEAAGLTPSAISNYVSKKQTPRADKALAIARALGVPADWLFDDAQDWPPPKASESSTIRTATDAEIVNELASRYRRAQLDFLHAAETVRGIDWNKAADLAERLKPNEKMPEFVRRATLSFISAQSKFNRISADLDVENYCVVHHAELPGGDRSIGDFEMISHGEVWYVIEKLPGVDRFTKAVRGHPELLNSPIKRMDEQYQMRQNALFAALAAKPKK